MSDNKTVYWAMFCEHLPDRDKVVKITTGHYIYPTKEKAQEACDNVRRQILPFRAWPVEIIDPRPTK